MDRYDMAEKLQELLEQAEEEIEMKDIPGYEGKYAVTADGRVWSYYSQIFLSLNDNGRGYLYAHLNKNGKTKLKRVNRLVAEAFVEKPEGWQPSWDAAHEDDNPYNNKSSNLKWKTRKENIDTEHFRKSHKSRGKCPVVCVETGEVYPSQAAAARDLGLCQRNISSVINGELKTTGGYHFIRFNKDSD